MEVFDLFAANFFAMQNSKFSSRSPQILFFYWKNFPQKKKIFKSQVFFQKSYLKKEGFLKCLELFGFSPRK